MAPTAPLPNDTVTSTSAALGADPRTGVARVRVWVVDDSPTDARRTQTALAGAHTVEVFHDAAVMLERLASGAAAPQLVLLDWHMPGLSGRDVLHFLRKRYDEVSLPVLVLTSSRRPEDLEAALGAGANDFLPKPFADVELLARTRTLVRVRTAAEALRAREAGARAAHARSERALADVQQVSEALRDSEERLSTILASLDEGVTLHDARGTIVFANAAAQRLLGLSLAQLQGRTPFDPLWRAVHEDGSDFPGADHHHMVALRTGAPSSGLMGIHQGAGRLLWLSVRARPLLGPDGRTPRGAVASFADITEARAAEEEVRRSQALIQGLVDNSPSVIYVKDCEGRYLLVNREYERLFQLDRAAAVGKTDADLHAGDTARAFGEVDRRVLSTGVAHTVEETVPTPQGPRVFVSVKFPLLDARGSPHALCGISTDVTERKRAEEALRRSERELRTLADAMPQQVWTATADGQPDYINSRRAEYLGLDPDAPLILDWSRTAHPEDAPCVAAAWSDAVTTGVPCQVEQRMRRSDGTYRWHLSRAVPVRDEQGRVQKWIATSTDIEDLKRAEAELRQRAEAEKQLIGIVSHDLRNPLSSILLSTQALLRTAPLTDRQARTVVRLHATAERATRLVRDLLDFTRARLGAGIPIERRPTDLHATVRAVLDEVRAAHPERTIELRSHGEGQGVWDGDRLAQVVTNLLNNALAYSPPGTAVQVETRIDAVQGSISVHNTGAPIPPELLEHVFTPMRRGTGEGGALGNIGLGLFIVRTIVRAHGGDIEVRSTAEEGTTFTARLPRS